MLKQKSKMGVNIAMGYIEELKNRLGRYSENVIAYKLDADFAAAVTEAIKWFESMQKEQEICDTCKYRGSTDEPCNACMYGQY